MSGSDTVITLDDVCVHFETSRLLDFSNPETVHAVDDVSLEIGENDVVALVGESGCGKTTLGKTAIGLQRPTAGHVRYRGQDLWATKDRSKLFARLRGDNDEIPFQQIRRSLQIIHQDPGHSLNSNYTIESILSDPLKRWEPELSEADRRARIQGMLEYVGMTPAEDYASRYPHQLSGGEQQRVALVRALLMNPELILADEAISALDVSLRVGMMDLMLDLQAQFGTSFLFVSHDLSNARYIAKKASGRIGIMYLGQLVEIGTVDQIITDPQHPYTKVLLWATPDLSSDGEVGDPPIRDIDIPDPEDPPSGCRFHTRCPEAREVCTRQEPQSFHVAENHEAACYRVTSDNDYWDSEPLADSDPDNGSGGGVSR